MTTCPHCQQPQFNGHFTGSHYVCDMSLNESAAKRLHGLYATLQAVRDEMHITPGTSVVEEAARLFSTYAADQSTITELKKDLHAMAQEVVDVEGKCTYQAAQIATLMKALEPFARYSRTLSAEIRLEDCKHADELLKQIGHAALDAAFGPMTDEQARSLTDKDRLILSLRRQLSDMTGVAANERQRAEQTEQLNLTLARALREAVPHMQHQYECLKGSGLGCTCGLDAAQRAAITALDELNIKKEVTR